MGINRRLLLSKAFLQAKAVSTKGAFRAGVIPISIRARTTARLDRKARSKIFWFLPLPSASILVLRFHAAGIYIVGYL
jgi:hypothetical protein